MDKHCNIYPYWGVHLDYDNEDEFICECPFCGHNDTRTGMGHFYVNAKKAAFCCKSGSCGKEGSWRDFLYYIYKRRYDKTTDNHLRLLAKEQGIPVPVLKKKKIAFDPKRGFLYPVVDAAGEVIDIRTYVRGGTEQSTKGCNSGITNLKAILEAKPHQTIHICEGWRDELALDWMFWRNGLSDQNITCSAPGSNTFKDLWATHFSNKNVVICYDNDEAGYGTFDPVKRKATGSKKVQSLLCHVTHNLRFVCWPDNLKDGYDARDLVIENKDNFKEALNKYNSMLSTTHHNDLKKDATEKTDLDTEKKEKEHIYFSSIVDTAKEVYELDEHFLTAFKLSLATVLSVKIPGDVNPWLFLVGAPASGKTAILGLFEKAFNHVVWESTLSTTALISGWALGSNDRTDPSILAAVDNKCLVLKDYTEILAKPLNERDEIFSTLRGAFDGRVKKPFGNGIREYRCNFSFLAGVTQEIRAHSTASLGERFLQYEPKIKLNAETIQEKAMNSQLLGKEYLDILEGNVADFLDNNYDFSGLSLLGRVPRWFRDAVKPLSRLVASLRTSVTRHERGLKYSHPIYEPVIESGNRVSIQLEKLAISLTLVCDKPQIDEEIYAIIQKVALDTAYSMSSRLVLQLVNSETSMTPKQLSEATGVKSAGAYIEDLEMLSLVEKNGKHGTQSAYKATKIIRDLWKRSNVNFN